MDMNFTDLVEMQKKSCEKYHNKKLYATKHQDHYEWITYQDLEQSIQQLQSHLCADTQPHDHVAIISPNSIEWVIIAYACLGLECAITPMYANQHVDEWIYILNDCHISCCFVANETLLNQILTRQDELPNLKELILIKGEHQSVRVVERLLKTPTEQKNQAIDIDPQSTAFIIYTSGTSGKPKGVYSHTTIS